MKWCENYQMAMHYLSHLAELGTTNLHPLGIRASAKLIDCLDLQPGQHLLEIGCGTGETMIRVALACDGTVSGVDVLPEMLRVAHCRLRMTCLQRRADLAQVEAGAPLPFPDNSFDRIYTESVLGFQDTASAGTLLAEVYRVLKVGGRYVANEAVWKPMVPDDIVASIYASCMADFGLCHASQQNWSADDWYSAMGCAGFHVLSADILLDHELEERRPPDKRVRLWLLLSHLLTSYYRTKGRLSPRLLGARLTYRKRLQHHSADGQFIEARLFVLQKP